MRKNITRLLQKGNIKPKDRVLLLVADDASRERDGKELLTDADRHALSEGWTPKDNNEVKEYNLYNEGRRNIAFAELDAQTTYLNATNGFLRASKYVSYILYKNYAKEGKTIKESIADRVFNSLLEKDQQGKALNLVLDYLGLELDYTIYLYAFELAGKELQADLLALYPYAKTERSYLEQEEIIYNLFNGKDKLSQTDKEKLAELIADECFNKHFGEWSFSGYFADIPLLEVARKWAEDNKIDYTPTPEETNELKEKYKEIKKEVNPAGQIKLTLTNRLTAYAQENKRDIKELLKDTIIKWIDRGDDEREALLDEYAPLFMSDKKATCNEQDTKLTRKEVFKKWLDVKAKATETIQGLIDKGELKTAKKTREFKKIKTLVEKLAKETGQTRPDTPITETKTIITGESLYNLKGDYQFIKDFRSQAEDFKIFGALVLFLRECSFVKDYATLLGFLELYKKLSKLFETDLTFKIKDQIEKFKNELEMLKMEFLMLADEITEGNYKADRVYYMTESYLEELLTTPFDPDSVKPDTERLKVYFDAFKKLFGDDF